jgi:hypothetical protein
MFVTPVTGVPAIVVATVAGLTGRVVDAVEQEELAMVERGGLPPVLAVALPTIGAHITMDVGCGRGVARIATVPC